LFIPQRTSWILGFAAVLAILYHIKAWIRHEDVTMMARLLACFSLIVSVSASRADDWPQWMGPNRDDRCAETGIVRALPPGGPKVLWRTPIHGGYAGPAVVNGRVYVADFETPGDTTGNPGQRSNLDGKERVLCLDAKTGREIWKHEHPCTYRISYPAGPRCTPTVSGGKVYMLGAEGDLTCLNAADGKLVWTKSLKDEYKIPAPMWGFTGHPLIDGDKLICLVGGDGTTLVAFDKNTGKELWRSLSSKEPGYCPPEIITAGGTRQLIIWTAESINSVNPETGKPYWSIDLEPSYGMAIMSPRHAGNSLFAGGIGFKSAMLKLATDKPAAEIAWNGTKETSVCPVNSTPIIEDGIIYGVDQPGQLRAVRLATGERLWETTAPTTGEKPANSGTAFLTKNGDRYFIFNEKGELVIVKLSPEKYEEISRAKILEPTANVFGRKVVWSHPAYANKCMFARNDKEIVCVSLAE
jgi:outer membrane protein assembly factor BamB